MPARQRAIFERGCLIATIALAVAVAAVWAVRVPFFQQPDERAHADYVFELYAVGHPFYVPHARPGQAVDADTRYLSRATRYRENRYVTHERMPLNYGTEAYFARLDRAAPPVSSAVPAAGATLPYVMFSYPAGYYALAALAMKAAAIAVPGSLAARFFAARFVGLGCLAITLWLAYGIFARSRLPRAAALLATFAIGLLPLCSWVSGYVQPDVLSTLLVTAAIAASLRAKDRPNDAIAPVLLSCSLVALAFVKEHYALATLAATALAAICARVDRRARTRFALAFVPPLVALVLATRFSPAGGAVAPNLNVYTAHGTPPLERVGDFFAFVVLGLRDVFAGGEPFDDFWFRFGYHPADTIVPPGFGRIAHGAFVAASLAVVALFVVRERFVIGRLVAIARRRSPLLALRLFAGDPILNVYAFVTTILLSIYAFSNGFVWLEGRYWLPVIVPLLAIVTARAVRPLAPVLRARASIALAATWTLYALVAAPLGLAAIERSFYTPFVTPRAGAREPYSDLLSTTATAACLQARGALDLRVRVGCAVRVSGFAVDGSRGLPAKDVYLTIDGVRAARARTLRPSPNIAHMYNDPALAHSGFEATLQTRALGIGEHTIGFAIAEDDAALRAGTKTFALDVAR